MNPSSDKRVNNYVIGIHAKAIELSNSTRCLELDLGRRRANQALCVICVVMALRKIKMC